MSTVAYTFAYNFVRIVAFARAFAFDRRTSHFALRTSHFALQPAPAALRPSPCTRRPPLSALRASKERTRVRRRSFSRTRHIKAANPLPEKLDKATLINLAFASRDEVLPYFF